MANSCARSRRLSWFASIGALALSAACHSAGSGAQAGPESSAAAGTNAGVALGAGMAGPSGGASPGLGAADGGGRSGAGGARSGLAATAGAGGAGARAADGGGAGLGPAIGGSSADGGSAGVRAADGGSAGARAADGGGGTAATSACSGGACAGSGLDSGPPTTPDPKFLVPASGPCPEFVNGDVMFMPDGVSRKVLLYIGARGQTSGGPLVFSWHSTIPDPSQANVWLGDSVIAEIEAQGGLVAAPYTADPTQTRPWDNVPGGAQNTDGDQRLMDEVVACAITKVSIDVRRIHAIGMSAGGLKTAQVSLRRSGYIASVVVYSGGLVAGDNPPDQDPRNLFAAMIFYGGPTDISPVDGIPYTDASQRYLDLITSQGRFGFLCNHGGGHSVPQDSQASAWRFMQDHPFGTSPSPYAKGLPAGFPSYCSLNMQ